MLETGTEHFGKRLGWFPRFPALVRSIAFPLWDQSPTEAKVDFKGLTTAIPPLFRTCV